MASLKMLEEVLGSKFPDFFKYFHQELSKLEQQTILGFFIFFNLILSYSNDEQIPIRLMFLFIPTMLKLHLSIKEGFHNLVPSYQPNLSDLGHQQSGPTL